MFAVLGLGEALARVIGFVGTIYVARRLGAEAYGTVAVATAILLYFSQIANFSVEMLGARELSKALPPPTGDAVDSEESRSVVDRIVPSLLLTRLALAVGCILVLTVVGIFVIGGYSGTVLALYSVTLLAVAASTRFVFIATAKPVVVAINTVVGELLALGIVLMFLRDPTDLVVAPIGRIVGEVGTSIVLLVILRRLGYLRRPHFAFGTARPLFNAARPLVAHAILGLAIFNSDLIFLRILGDERSAGMYAASYALVSFLLNLGVTYAASVLPALAREHGDSVRQLGVYRRAMGSVLTVGLPVAVGGTLLAGDLLDLTYGQAYGEAVRPLQILLCSIVVAWMRNVAQAGLVVRDRETSVLRATAWSAALNCALNLLLIPRWGMIGAASATFLTEAVRTVVAVRYTTALGLPFGRWHLLWRPALGVSAMAALLWWVEFPHVALAVVAGAVTYGLILIVTNGIQWTEGGPSLRV